MSRVLYGFFIIKLTNSIGVFPSPPDIFTVVIVSCNVFLAVIIQDYNLFRLNVRRCDWFLKRVLLVCIRNINYNATFPFLFLLLPFFFTFF